MYIDNLIVEVTRQCNLKCKHCLRGTAQKVNMSIEIIDAIFKDITEINSITFSGGEPTLAVNVIRYINSIIILNKIPLQYFYVVTNGVIASRALVETLVDLYARINDYDEISGLVISGDQFHREEAPVVVDAHHLYSALKFYRPEDRNTILESFIREGRARNMSGRLATPDRFVLDDDDVDVRVCDGEVYINALGDVIPGCNFSYASQEKHKIGNVLEKPLKGIIVEYANKEAVNA